MCIRDRLIERVEQPLGSNYIGAAMRYYVGRCIGGMIVYMFRVLFGVLALATIFINDANRRSPFRSLSIVIVLCFAGASGSMPGSSSDNPWAGMNEFPNPAVLIPNEQTRRRWPDGETAYGPAEGQRSTPRTATGEIDYSAPAVKNDPRAGSGARLPNNEVLRTVTALSLIHI